MNERSSPLERIGNILAFGLILTIVGIGGYAIYGALLEGWDLFSFGGSEEIRPTPMVVVRQPTLTPFEGLVLGSPATETPASQPATPAPPTPTPEPKIETVLPPTATPSPTLTATATETPLPTATPYPTETPYPTPVPPTPTPSYLFRVSAAGPDYGRGCDGFYIFGYVRDAAGNLLPGLRVRVYNQYGYEIPPTSTKEEPRGWYDVLISRERATWYVQVVDAANNPLSPAVEVVNTGNYIPGSEACWHQVDFSRLN